MVEEKKCKSYGKGEERRYLLEGLKATIMNAACDKIQITKSNEKFKLS